MTTDLAIAAIRAQTLWDEADRMRKQAAELHPEFARMLERSAHSLTSEEWETIKMAAEEARGEMGDTAAERLPTDASSAPAASSRSGSVLSSASASGSPGTGGQARPDTHLSARRAGAETTSNGETR